MKGFYVIADMNAFMTNQEVKAIYAAKKLRIGKIGTDGIAKSSDTGREIEIFIPEV